MKMKLEEYVEEFDVGEAAAASAASRRFREKSELAVFPPDFPKAYHLAFGTIPSLKIVPIVGMAGIGKTTLAKEILRHPNIRSFFECRVLVKVGRDCRPEQIRRDILRKIDPEADRETPDEGVEILVRRLLEARRYLVVLDDVWDLQLWRKVRKLFDYKSDHSGVVITTRLQEVALGASDDFVQMSFLNKEECWDLLRDKMFGRNKNSLPPEFEEMGKEIAEKCDGLPLTIVTVADILTEAEGTPEHWTQIAESKSSSSLFMAAYDQIYEVLLRSYHDLSSNPVMVPCFLYMGAFPHKYEIPASKLIKLWGAEEFLDRNSSKTAAELSVEYLEGLHSRSLVVTVQESSNGGIKTCRLHSVFWHLCNVEASKERVFMGLNSYHDFDEGEIEHHRRFSINSSVLLTIEHIRDRIAKIPVVHSLLCFGTYHQYQVRLYFNSKSLKVIDVLSIRFHYFPAEVVELVQLRNLALTCSGRLPASISKLKFLEFLIIRRHLSLKSSRVSRYLPMEIWEMKSLKHLQVSGSNLPHPNGDELLPNLLTLLDVGAQSCTKSVLERIPNLEKLGIQFDVTPACAEVETPSWKSFDYHISHLHKLKSLKCEIVNPVLIQHEVGMAPRLPILPSGLKKLSLSGFGYPWEEMSKIASLPDLEVLKLRCFAFRGLKWEARDKEFPALKYLRIEDTDLLEWSAASSSFYRIQRIILKNCYRLKDIPLKFWNNVYSGLVDCNPFAAKIKVQQSIPLPHRKIRADNSWESGVF